MNNDANPYNLTTPCDARTFDAITDAFDAHLAAHNLPDFDFTAHCDLTHMSANTRSHFDFTVDCDHPNIRSCVARVVYTDCVPAATILVPTIR